MRIQHNISSMNALRNLSVTNKKMSDTMEKLSSGYRINRAADDAAGLAISEKMRAQIGGLEVASRNAQDGVSFIQTAEGALGETHNILRRMRDLSVQAANGVNSDEDRNKLNEEVTQLKNEVSRIANQTEFNDEKLLDGNYASGSEISFHIGPNKDQTIEQEISTQTASALGVDALDISTASGAESAIAQIDSAINQVSSTRANLGAVQNRLEHTIKNLDTTRENLQASESRIRDTDMAKQMANMTKQQVLQQAGTAMLSQANQKSQSVLQVLG